MSKRAQIRNLSAQGKSDQEIADVVGCSQSYVRVARQDRRTIDAAYRARNPEYQARMKLRRTVRLNLLRCGVSRTVANAAAREAYAAMRDEQRGNAVVEQRPQGKG